MKPLTNQDLNRIEGFAIAAERDRLKALNAELVEALEMLLDHMKNDGHGGWSAFGPATAVLTRAKEK